MSWLYSQALVAAYSEENSWDGEPCAQLNVMPTQHKFWHNDKTMEFSKLSQFGLTCAVLTGSLGADVLTWYLAAFPAKTSALQEKAKESQALEAECGKKWRGLLAKYDPATSLWKTAQCSLLEDLERSLETWPKWGSMQNGRAYLRPKLVPTTNEKESGYSPVTADTPSGNRPTPTCSDVMTGNLKSTQQKAGSMHSVTLPQAVQRFSTPTTMDALPPKSEKALMREAQEVRSGRSKPSNLRDQVSNAHLWPAPDANMGARGTQAEFKPTRKSGAHAQYTINQAVRDSIQNFPTPTSRAAPDCPAERRRKSPSLAACANMYPTPQASDNRYRGNLSSPCVQRRKEKGKQVMLSQSVSNVSEMLNPDWVCWLMQWPYGWTDLSINASDDYAQWLATQNTWWQAEPNIPRTSKDKPHYKSQLKAIGNGQVPLCMATAFVLLSERIKQAA